MGEAGHPHAEPAGPDVHVVAGRQLADKPAPLAALSDVKAEADGAADVVEHEWAVGKGARQIDQFARAGCGTSSVEEKAKRSEPGDPLVPPGVRRQTRGADDRRSPGRLVGMRGGDEAHASEVPPAAAIIASSTFSTGARSAKSAWPTMPEVDARRAVPLVSYRHRRPHTAEAGCSER